MTLQTTFSRISDTLLDLVFPPHCIGCGVEGALICDSCQSALPGLEPPYCSRCGLPLAEKSLCPKCSYQPPGIDGIRSVFLHEGLAREMVHSLKYGNLKSLAGPLAGFMRRYLEDNPIPADIIVAVPLHASRLRKRGYNQAHLLAKKLGKSAGIAVCDGALTRARRTPSQVALKASDRSTNMSGAFVCTDDIFSGKRVLIIDDVCTTGSTMDACAEVIKASTPLSIWGLTLSRENLKSQEE